MIGSAVKNLMRNSLPNDLFNSGGLLKENMSFINQQKANLDSDNEEFDRAEPNTQNDQMPIESSKSATNNKVEAVSNTSKMKLGFDSRNELSKTSKGNKAASTSRDNEPNQLGYASKVTQE